MVAPEPTAKPAPKTPPKPIEKPAATSSRKPTRGAEVKTGAAVADTGSTAQVPFGGLSTGGGGTGGATVDVQNFCCPDYIQLMVQQVYGNWDYRVERPGLAVVKFTIQRDGRITDVALVRSSGYTAHDMNAQRALHRTRQLAPLPAQFSNPTLGVQLTFDYKR